eukprot:943458-Prymnesium_polylepis.2
MLTLWWRQRRQNGPVRDEWQRIESMGCEAASTSSPSEPTQPDVLSGHSDDSEQFVPASGQRRTSSEPKDSR